MAIVMNNHVFKGHRTLLGNKYVTYGELELPLRFELYQKSKNGFDWGNTNKAANQLAFSMLYQLSNDTEISSKCAEDFAKDVIKKLNSRDWVLSAAEVLNWMEKNCELPKKDAETPQKRIASTVHVKTETQKNTAKKSTKKKKENVVKDVCKELSITQKQLAEILEVPEGTVSSWAVKNEIPRLGKKAIEFYIQNQKNQKIVDSYKQFLELINKA